MGDFNNDHQLDVAVSGYSGGSIDWGILLGKATEPCSLLSFIPSNTLPDRSPLETSIMMAI